jgi:hypothetical protein
MNTSEEPEGPVRSRSWESLASPFLEQELFIGEGEGDWQARLVALEAETSFTAGLQQASTLAAPPELQGPLALPRNPPLPDLEEEVASVEVSDWKRGEAITVEAVKKVADALGKSPHEEDWFHAIFSCEHWALQLVCGLITGRVHYPKDERTLSWPGKSKRKLPGYTAVYDIKREEGAAKGWIRRVFPRPAGWLPRSALQGADDAARDQKAIKADDGRAAGFNSKRLGLTDRLKFYAETDPVGNPSGLATGWYVERGFPYDKGTYKLIYTTERGRKVPLKLQSGDIIDTAEGENGVRFELRHKQLVVIEGNEVSTWGNVRRKDAEPPGIQKDSLYLIPIYRRDAATYDRRIIIGVWRFDYSAKQSQEAFEEEYAFEGGASRQHEEFLTETSSEHLEDDEEEEWWEEEEEEEAATEEKEEEGKDITPEARKALWQRDWGWAAIQMVREIGDENILKDPVGTENWITDQIFFARHPDRVVGGRNKPLKPGERDFQELKQEWDDIRGIVVRPALGFERPRLSAGEEDTFREIRSFPIDKGCTLRCWQIDAVGAGAGFWAVYVFALRKGISPFQSAGRDEEQNALKRMKWRNTYTDTVRRVLALQGDEDLLGEERAPEGTHELDEEAIDTVTNMEQRQLDVDRDGAGGRADVPHADLQV